MWHNLSARKKVNLGIITVLIVGLLAWAIVKKPHIFADTTPQAVGGVVTDRNGSVLGGVKISQVGNLSNNTTSASNGTYRLGNLPTGEVKVIFEKYGTPFTITFTDVGTSHWAYREIAAANKAGIISGYSNNTFRPDAAIDRAGMAVIIARALAMANGLVDSSGKAAVPAGPTTASFKDVGPTHWAYKEVEYLKSQGIVTGFSEDNTFRPDTVMTRDQMVVFLVRSLNLELVNDSLLNFTDLPTDYWAYKEIMTLVSEGVVSGYTEPDGTLTFRPSATITRDQAAVFIVRTFKNIPMTSGGFSPQTITFSLDNGTVAQFNPVMTAAGKFGKVYGQAKNANGAIISGARVVLDYGPESEESYSVNTDANGNYTIYNVPEGPTAYYVYKKDSIEPYQIDNFENMVLVKGATALNLFNLK